MISVSSNAGRRRYFNRRMVRWAEALRRPVRPARERPAFGPAPKEQPPRKLSGKRTARD
jgi:hypothetical protein